MRFMVYPTFFGARGNLRILAFALVVSFSNCHGRKTLVEVDVRVPFYRANSFAFSVRVHYFRGCVRGVGSHVRIGLSRGRGYYLHFIRLFPRFRYLGNTSSFSNKLPGRLSDYSYSA
jgi:hypothetical protein